MDINSRANRDGIVWDISKDDIVMSFRMEFLHNKLDSERHHDMHFLPDLVNAIDQNSEDAFRWVYKGTRLNYVIVSHNNWLVLKSYPTVCSGTPIKIKFKITPDNKDKVMHMLNEMQEFFEMFENS